MKHQVLYLAIAAAMTVPLTVNAGYSIIQLGNYNVANFDTALASWCKPGINDSGQVVWTGYNDGGNQDIYLFNGKDTIKLSNSSRWNLLAKINNRGQVVWLGHDGHDTEIYLYDGTKTINLTNNGVWADDRQPDINDSGQVVWTLSDGWGDFEIAFYDGTNIIRLTNNTVDDYGAKINNRGQVVWYGGYIWENIPNNDWEIYFYDGTKTIQLTDNTVDDLYAEINDSGWIAWEGYDE